MYCKCPLCTVHCTAVYLETNTHPRRYYCPGGATSPTEVDCPAGGYCGEGAGEPELCPAGTFSNATRLTESDQCTDCTEGIDRKSFQEIMLRASWIEIFLLKLYKERFCNLRYSILLLKNDQYIQVCRLFYDVLLQGSTVEVQD